MHPEMFDSTFYGVSTAIWLSVGTCLVLLYRLTRPIRLLVELPGPPRNSWKSGNFHKFSGPNAPQFDEHLASTYGPTVRICAGFGEEVVWTCDPAALHAVFVKDRATFERPVGSNLLLKSIFGGGLLSKTGEDHRMHRKLLSPVFTMKFLRELMPIFMDIADQTCDSIKKKFSSAQSMSEEIDVFPWATAAALELVGEAGLGHSLDSFTGQRNEYNIAIKSVVRVLATVSPYVKILPFAYRIGTPAFRRWALRYLPIGGLKQLQQLVSIQNEQADEILNARQNLISSGGDLSSQAGRGRDIMTLLMKANEAKRSDSLITRQEMIGHMNTFVFAGHETTSTAVSRILNILADRPEVQVKLREEIRQYFEQNKDDINHDALLELPYLDGVVRETLRLYVPVMHLARNNLQDAVLPLQYPVETPTGSITNVPLKKGTRVVLSLYMANRYAKIWGDRANEFLPERWIGSKLDEVKQQGAHLPGVYSSMMSFGAGPTACIGFKFAVLEIKVMMAALVKNFRFEPSQLHPAQWEAYGIQFPYLQSEQSNPDKLPKLPLRVTKL